MHTVMAVAAERYEVFWAVRAAIRATDDMMDLKDLALRFPAAYPACVSISIEYVFSGIPEAELFSFLIFFASDFRILYLLDVECGCFDCDMGYRKERGYEGCHVLVG